MSQTARFLDELLSQPSVAVKQRRELAEIIGFETRNKYVIERSDGSPLGFAAEQQKGLTGFLLRQMLGHWRPYTVLIFNNQRELVLKAEHPFGFYFQSLRVADPGSGAPIGRLQQRFSILSKRFDVMDAHDNVIMTVNSPLLKIWTFPFKKGDQEAAVIKKVWGGVLKESITDADTFQIQFTPGLSVTERALVLAAGIFVDLQYFEAKAR